MRKILIATSALALFGANAAFAQDYEPADMNAQAAPGMVGGQNLDTGVTTGSTTTAQPFWLPRQSFQAANSVKPSDQNDAPEPDFDVFDPGVVTDGITTVAPGEFASPPDAGIDRSAVTASTGNRRIFGGRNAADDFDASY